MGLKDEVNAIRKEVVEVKQISQETFAGEILKDYKRANKRQFITILIILFMWFATLGYLVYVLNDIGVEETTTTQEVSQENDNGSNNFIGNDGVINNGKTED